MCGVPYSKTANDPKEAFCVWVCGVVREREEQVMVPSQNNESAPKMLIRSFDLRIASHHSEDGNHGSRRGGVTVRNGGRFGIEGGT